MFFLLVHYDAKKKGMLCPEKPMPSLDTGVVEVNGGLDLDLTHYNERADIARQQEKRL